MKWNLVLILMVFLHTSVLLAHQPDISNTVLIEKEDGTWILQIKAALTAFQYEITARHGDNAYDTPEMFKELVIEHVRENIQIQFNHDDEVVLQKPFVQLGHETNVLFEVVGMPKDINTAFIQNRSFKDISRNQSSLFILKDGFSKEQFLLNTDNNHSVKLIARNSSFVLQENKSNKASVPLSFWTLGFMIAVGLAYCVYRNDAKFRLG